MLFIVFLLGFLKLSFAEDTGNFTCSIDDIERDEWDTFYPDDTNTTGSCKMKVLRKSSKSFHFKIFQQNANFVYLRLNFISSGSLCVKSRPCVVEPYIWIWTYKGPGGAHQFLNWPMEYNVWSLGLLDTHTFGPIDINITVTGNCSVNIGGKNTTGRLAVALKNMVESAYSRTSKVKYRRCYFCYKHLTALSKSFYHLCNFITCPVEAIGYKCCDLEWNTEKGKFILSCPGNTLVYRRLWWVIPFIIGSLVYLYVPIILLKIGEILKLGMNKSRTLNALKLKISYQSMGSVNDDVIPLDSENEGLHRKMIFESPVSAGAIISHPFQHCFKTHPVCMSRLLRFVFSVMTMSVMFFKIFIHGMFQYDFILDSVKHGVPMDFLSVFAGFEESRHNFMEIFGGPYIACGLYLFTLTVLLCYPKDIASFLEHGLPNNPNISTSPLCLDMESKLRFGSTSVKSSANGYRKIYMTMINHFLMLLNSNFWKHVFKMQKDRWCGILSYFPNYKPYLVIFHIFMLPFYISFCSVELIFCILYFGFPIVFCLHVFLRAFSLPIYQNFSALRFITKVIGILFVIFQTIVILFVMYMFTTIFVDSFVFISRVIVFTYTGLFAYPASSFSYVIFGFSLIMYGADSIKSISKVYHDLFVRTSSLCKQIQEENPELKPKIWMLYRGYSGIPHDLFQFILHRHRPIRIEVFFSIFKISILVCIIYVSVSLLESFKANKHHTTITGVISTIFVCFIPKLLKESVVFSNKKKDREFDWTLEETITDFRKEYENEIVIRRFSRHSDVDDRNREELGLLKNL